MVSAFHLSFWHRTWRKAMPWEIGIIRYIPCPDFPLSIAFCSSGVKLYVLKDLGWNPSFSLILWSQCWDLGNQSTKMSKYLWYSLIICSGKGRSLFCWLISACIIVAMDDLALIQRSWFTSLMKVAISTESSVLGKGCWVQFRCSSLSGFSTATVLGLGCLYPSSFLTKALFRQLHWC